jgi:large subunit ribosomal protein L6
LPKFGNNLYMSKIGKLPVELPENVQAKMLDHSIEITGPKGNLSIKIVKEIGIEINEKTIQVSLKKETKTTKAIFGTTRALIANMVEGVTKGWSKKMEIIGTGYRAEVQGNTLVLTVGFSHPVKIEAPKEITFKVEKNIITIEGINKELVGQISANIRGVRPPEPYKGKGIKYVEEVIRRKAGKAAKAAGAA